MELTESTENTYGFFFRLGMWWRIFYGFLRILLSLILLRLVGIPFADIFYDLMSHEIIENKADFLIRTISPFLEHFSFTVTYFLVTHLVFWGFLDIILSVSMLRHRLWAFPVSIYLMGMFVLYEMYRFTHTHSLILLWVIFIDIIIIWLIRKEYTRLRGSMPARP
jgi:uncharacterized membrane protein